MSNETIQNDASASRTTCGNRMIDSAEELFTLTEATKIMPRVNGRRPAVSTLWRWCRKGLRGVRLEYLRIGRNIVTSRQALLRFFANLADADSNADDSVPVGLIAAKNRRFLTKGKSLARRKSIEQAEAILEEAGI